MKRGQHPNSRANLRPQRKGAPPLNPGGRPKGFASQLKSWFGEDYERISEGLYLIAMGTPAQRRKFFGAVIRVTTRDRLRALEMARDSGPGRPTQVVEIDDRPMVPAFALPNGDEVAIR